MKRSITAGAFLLCLLALCGTSATEFCEDEECKTKTRVESRTGPVEGHIIYSHPRRNVTAFYGIPFAEPPIGKLRFRPPEPVKHWRNPLNATTVPKKCPQPLFPFPIKSEKSFIVETSEDCLKLNIWVPEDVPNYSSVMVFIHGGAFILGGALDGFVDGINLAAEENIIVVTIAYRVGPMGFLFLDLEEAPGNVGLLDQQLALKWVKENIAYFGGSPDKITIFGVSAGASSVGYQLLSEGSKGLFKRAIMISGSPANPWAFRDQKVAFKSSQDLAKALGYEGDIENKKEMFEYLVQQDFKKFETYETPGVKGALSPKLFGPTTDRTFLRTSPRDAIEKGLFFSKNDLMIGTVKDEAAFFLEALFPELFKRGDLLGLSKQEYHDVIKNLTLRDLDDDYTRIVGKFYANDLESKTPENLRDLALAAAGDSLFSSDVDHFAEAYHKSGNRVYKYLFDQLTLPILPKWAGAPHGSDQMITLSNLEGLVLPKDLKDFGRLIMRRWANFARIGQPNLYIREKNGDVAIKPPNWPEYQLDGREYMILKAGNYTVGKHYRARENAMWYHLLNLLELTF